MIRTYAFGLNTGIVGTVEVSIVGVGMGKQEDNEPLDAKSTQSSQPCPSSNESNVLSKAFDKFHYFLLMPEQRPRISGINIEDYFLSV